ncbi:hypothetical protein KAH27_02175 [bacterium]|nr:hypothetical protein [bacterium]
MKNSSVILLLILTSKLLFGAAHFVSTNGTSISPYTSWETAATNIQDAVDIAVPGEEIFVTNGVYQSGGALTPGFTLMNRVMIDKAVAVHSINGPENTIIEGGYSSITRCVYLTNGAVLSGFILRYGNTTTNNDGNFFYERSGGGVLLDHGGLVSNCFIRYNSAISGWGGGVFCYSGGIVVNCDINDNFAVNVGGACCEEGGEIINSKIYNNTAGVFIGGVSCNNGGIIDGCIISNNTVVDANIGGGICSGGGVIKNSIITGHSVVMTEFSTAGGLEIGHGGTAEWCRITDNISREKGAGVYLESGGVMRHCFIKGNSSKEGAGVYCKEFASVENSFFCDNSGNMGGGLYLIGSAYNCTFSGNYVTWRGGGVYCADSGKMVNSLIYNNEAPEGTNIFLENPGTGITYCCTTPLISGSGNISANPMLAGVFNPHIVSNSPCINTGINSSVPVSVDIDFEQRIFGGTVDIGCDEFINGGMTGGLSVAIITDYTNSVINFPLTFISDIQGKADTFQWNIEGFGIPENKTFITKMWSTPGNYKIELKASNVDYPAGVSATVEVHIVSAFTNYAAVNSAMPVPPYSSWSTAAANIQDAIDVCPAGGIVLVSNGLYSSGGEIAAGSSNRIAIMKPITVMSIAGAENTIITGVKILGYKAVRCAYVGEGACLIGFTLTNGATSKTGSENRDINGGGIFIDKNATVSNCVVKNNQAWYRGGGIFIGSESVVQNCLIADNLSGNGGGVYCDSAAVLISSRIFNNESYAGAGVFLNFGAKADRCIVQSNICLSAGMIPGTGGGVASLNGSALNNSLILYNYVEGYGGGVFCGSEYVNEFMTINNCTISKNEATFKGGGVYCMETLGHDMWATVRNSIIYDNLAPEGSNFHNDVSTTVYSYCCTIPEPYGPENITNIPEFIDKVSGNFHLPGWSPCVNAGTNAFAAMPYDLDGDARIIDGKVDIGCYEFIPEPCNLLFIIYQLLLINYCKKKRFLV